MTGSRAISISLILGLFYVYWNKKRIPIYILISLFLLGIISLSIIGSIRGGEGNTEESNVGVWGFFLDLIINNRNLFDAYSIVQSKGYEPSVLIGPILAVIPFAQFIYTTIFNIPPYKMNSAMYITVDHFGANPPVGLGTNIVGDVYLGGGTCTTVILLFALGYLVSKSLFMIHN